jgi:hypothetical protein
MSDDAKFILGFGWWYLQAFGLLIEPACIVRVEGGHRIKPSPENVLAVVHRLGGRPGVVLLPTFQLQVRLLPDFAPTSRAWTDGESDSAAHRQPIAPPGPAVR